MKLSIWLQILTVLSVCGAIIFESITKAHWGYIVLTGSGYIWAISEKLAKKGK